MPECFTRRHIVLGRVPLMLNTHNPTKLLDEVLAVAQVVIRYCPRIGVTPIKRVSIERVGVMHDGEEYILAIVRSRDHTMQHSVTLVTKGDGRALAEVLIKGDEEGVPMCMDCRNDVIADVIYDLRRGYGMYILIDLNNMAVKRLHILRPHIIDEVLRRIHAT